jgi:nucleoside-diphosphate-sugar epimerase
VHAADIARAFAAALVAPATDVHAKAFNIGTERNNLTVAEIARDLGRLYAETGRPAQARSALREAVEAFGDLGALGEARATRLELETLGAG